VFAIDFENWLRPFMNGHEVTVCKNGDAWEECIDSFTDPRGPSHYGPARQVSESPFAIVVGTRTSSEKDAKLLFENALYLANLHFMAHGTYVPLLLDTDFPTDRPFGRNAVFVGGASVNSGTEEVNLHRRETPEVSFSNSGFSLRTLFGPCKFDGPGIGSLFIGPWVDGGHLRMYMVISASDERGLRDIIKVGTPTIPPMTRGPFMNMVPDWVVTGPEFSWKGVGGYLGVGYWGNDWEWRADTSYCVPV